MVVSLLPNLSNADDAVVLKEGEKAPYSGVLLTNQKANEIRNNLEEKTIQNDSLNRTIILYKKNEDINNERVNILLEQNKNTLDQLKSSEYKPWILIGLSVIATLGAVYAGKKVTQ
jgi:hypothetical protein